jgi:hypothetical protein
MSNERTAACPCRALTITVAGDPLVVNGCTCTDCQRASGSVMTVSAWFADEQIVRIVGDYARWRPDGPPEDDDFAAFCPTCGGGGFFKHPAQPGATGIRIGTFADPTFPKPKHIVWWSDRPYWLPELDATRHERMPE